MNCSGNMRSQFCNDVALGTIATGSIDGLDIVANINRAQNCDGSQYGTMTHMANGSVVYNGSHTRRSGVSSSAREQERLMPIANVIRVMRRVLPSHAKIADDAKESIQECVSEFISLITSEANERCQREQRKTVTAEDLLWAMQKLGFDNYLPPLSSFLHKYRDMEGGSFRGEPTCNKKDGHPFPLLRNLPSCNTTIYTPPHIISPLASSSHASSSHHNFINSGDFNNYYFKDTNNNISHRNCLHNDDINNHYAMDTNNVINHHHLVNPIPHDGSYNPIALCKDGTASPSNPPSNNIPFDPFLGLNQLK